MSQNETLFARAQRVIPGAKPGDNILDRGNVTQRNEVMPLAGVDHDAGRRDR